MRKKIAIAGAGFSGATIARILAETNQYQIEIFETRDHIAGNCHTIRDPETNILLHKYGPHIFHTDDEKTWAFVNRFSDFKPFLNRVKAHTDRGMFSLPINLLTINQLFNKKFNPAEAKAYIETLATSYPHEPQNFEEQALSMVGEEIYETFFKGYTLKQWGVDPTELPASILKRLPLRFNYDDNYFFHKYQGIPSEGYTQLVENMLDHDNITVHLQTAFPKVHQDQYDHSFFSGPIDKYFDSCYGALGYRTLDFIELRGKQHDQGNAVINYCSEWQKHTRISEHRYFAPHESHEDTVLYVEYSRNCEEQDTPYYPLRLQHDKSLLAQYYQKADEIENIEFVGRLGTYQYYDMDRVISEARELALEFIMHSQNHNKPFKRKLFTDEQQKHLSYLNAS